MRNVVTFDVRGVCNCVCVMNILDGSDDINLIFEIGDYENPQIEIIAANNTTTTALTVENGVATFELKLSLFDGNEIVKTRFIGGDKIGKQFTWLAYGYNGIDGGNVPIGYTMRVNRETDDIFVINMYSVNTKPASSYDNDSFDVTDTGELSLKTPINVSVTTNSDDQVTNVDFEYKDNYHKSFSIEWNENQKITKFGNLPINWG